MTTTISTFAQRFMQQINGQQMLPQSIFRSFLNELVAAFSGVTDSTTITQISNDVATAKNITDMFEVDKENGALYFTIGETRYSVTLSEVTGEE